MRLFSAIRAGIVSLTSLYITFCLEKYAMPFLPDKPNWVVYLFLVLSVAAIIVCAVFWDNIVSAVFKRNYNWAAWKVLRYLRTWTKLRGCYIHEIEEKLRQAALDGDIRVWAVLDIVGPLRKIDAERFAKFTFDLRHAMRRPDLAITPPPQFVPKIYEQGHRDNFLHKEIYYDPWFSKREIKKVWPRQWLRSLLCWIKSRRRDT